MEAGDLDGFYAALGKRIQRARQALGWTQRGFAERFSPPMLESEVRAIERGRLAVFRVHDLFRVAEVLGVPVSALLPLKWRG